MQILEVTEEARNVSIYAMEKSKLKYTD